MLDYEERELKVQQAVAEFPETFGLRAFPNKTFTISRTASYMSDFPKQDTIYLYVYLDGQAFCKGTPEELRKAIVRSNNPKEGK